MRERFGYLDMARGFAMLLVVFQHICQSRIGAWPGYYHVNWVLELLRMPVLMMVSGVLTAKSIVGSAGKLLDRCLRFAWLVVIWSSFLLLVPAVVNGTDMPSMSDLVESAVSPGTALWFIWALIPLSLSLFLIARRGTRTRSAVLLALAAVSTMLNAGWLPTASLAGVQLMNYAFFFALGGLRGGPIVASIDRQPLTVLVASAALLVTSHLVDGWLARHMAVRLLIVPERLAVCLLVLVAFRYAVGLGRVTKPLLWFGRNTLPVYVAHGAFVSILEHHISDLGTRSAYALPWLNTGLVVVASIAIERVFLALGARWMYSPPAWFTWDQTRWRRVSAR